MKLYYSPGACSMSCHIALTEAKLPFEAINVGKSADEQTKKAFLAANPLGAVPTLQLDGSRILTQNIAILEYVADQKPESKLLAAAGTFERAETMRWLSLAASDLHPAYSPLFRLSAITTDPRAESDVKSWALGKINKLLTFVENHMQDRQFLVGDHLTIADCYFYTVFQWNKVMQIPTDKFPALNRYSDMISKLPAVVAVREAESANKVH